MTWVKVCGLSTPEDVRVARQFGADAIGFVFYPPSPRVVTVEQAFELGSGFEGTRVALTVDAEPSELLRLAAASGVDAVQPYGTHAVEAAGAAQREGLQVFFPLVVVERADLSTTPGGAMPLLDSAVVGGTGETFDWDRTEGIDGDFVLAGGLSPENIEAAVHRVRPWGVDASSGLESAPGIKDPAKVAAFIEKAKASDATR